MYRQRLKTESQRFFEKVKKTDSCWVWTACNNRYGKLWFRGKPYNAHRASWEMHFGEIPEGMCVLHKCDNTLCVNPEHLFLGTQLDNVRDMWTKGRSGIKGQPPGEKHALSKLKESDVVQIKRKIKNGEKINILSNEYGVSVSQIHRIASGKRWSHVSF